MRNEHVSQSSRIVTLTFTVMPNHCSFSWLSTVEKTSGTPTFFCFNDEEEVRGQWGARNLKVGRERWEKEKKKKQPQSGDSVQRQQVQRVAIRPFMLGSVKTGKGTWRWRKQIDHPWLRRREMVLRKSWQWGWPLFQTFLPIRGNNWRGWEVEEGILF